MPNFDSLRALKIMQELHLDIPFIIVSGTIGEERAVQVMQHGAADYIIKMARPPGTGGQAGAVRRHLKDEKLKAEQTAMRLAAIVASSYDAIDAKDLDGIVTSRNSAAERLFGYKAQEIVGKHISMLFPCGRRRPEMPENFQDAARRLANGEDIKPYETVRVRKDGRRLEVLMSVSPIRDTAGIMMGVSGICHDIPDRSAGNGF